MFKKWTSELRLRGWI